jgi:hypothetical protein
MPFLSASLLPWFHSHSKKIHVKSYFKGCKASLFGYGILQNINKEISEPTAIVASIISSFTTEKTEWINLYMTMRE